MKNPFRSIRKYQPIDKDGTELIYGDVLIELNRGQAPNGKGGIRNSCIIWVYMGQTDTRGFHPVDGELTYFYHVDASKSKILDFEKFSDKVVSEFMKGAIDLYIDENDNRDIYEIINSNGLF